MKSNEKAKSFVNLTLPVVILYLSFSAIAVKGDWKSDANARIEQNRKRNAEITVVDSLGQPVPGLNVQITQTKHRFGFGTAIPYGLLNSNSTYRSFVLDHFEWAVCENAMKWGSNENTRDDELYGEADYIANWCAANNIVLRGHNIVWETGSQTPSWVSGLSCSTYPPTSEMMDEIDERINSIVGRYAGQIVSWDVDNEMLSGNMFDCLGEAGRAHFFQLANSIDPDCGFYMNEYSGNSFGGYDGDAYVARAQGLIALGAPVEGLGIQAHVASPFQPENYYNNVLNELDNLGLPIIATEFDTDAGTATQVADDLENFYRICFSHPSVEGIMMWGCEQSAWRWDGIVNSSTWVLNEAGVRYEALLNEWTTNDSNVIDLAGYVGFRGFHGTYEITLSSPGETNEIYELELEPGTTPEQFEIVTALVPPGPDYNAPTPDPMTWATAPHATGSTSISMTATTASDPYGVEYYFDCLTPGGHDCNWTSNPTYQDAGLNPNTQYTYRVKARDKSPNHNVTGWSTEQSAVTEPPSTDVEIGSWASGLSNDATEPNELGANRALIFIAHGEYNGGDMNLISVTYGGQTMTKVKERNASTGTGYRNYVVAYILNEQGIANANSGTFVPAWSITPESASYASVFLSNVNQTTPFGPNDSNGTAGSTPLNPIKTNALITENGDIVIEGATCGNNGSYILNNGFIEGTDQSVGINGHTGVTGHKKTPTGSSETPSATYSPTVNRQVIIGFVVKAAPLSGYQNCPQVQEALLRLPSDLNGDCYVDYDDLDIFVNNWLHNDCTGPNNCQNADFEPVNGVVDSFDFGNFALQWTQCNDPNDPTCTPNW